MCKVYDKREDVRMLNQPRKEEAIKLRKINIKQHDKIVKVIEYF